MTICIAKSKKSLGHYFLRIVPTEEVYKIPDEGMPALINSLTTVKSHKQLATAVEHLPLLLDTKGGSNQPKRVMTTYKCIDLLDSEFGPVEKKTLAYEMFLYAPKELRANSSKESPAADLDAYDTHFADELKKLGDEYRVIVEPIQDWMTFRNLLAMGAALLTNIENLPKGGRVLEASGFYAPKESAYGFPVFVAPLKFQASIYLTNFLKHPVASNNADRDNTDYLYWLYQPQGEAIKRKGGLFPVNTYAFGGIDDDVFVSTHWDATRKSFNFTDIATAPFSEDRYLYLVIRQSGSQLDMAKKIVQVLWETTRDLIDNDGALLGITQDTESLFLPKQNTPTYSFHSLISKAWYDLCYHENRRLIACKHCGCGVLASLRGPIKEYCSDSCRTQE
jgi:hypothetical protein